jgi:hypothetical protein
VNQAWNRLDPHIQEDPVPESAIKDLVTILEGVNDQRFDQANGPQTRFDPLPILFGDLTLGPKYQFDD